MEGSETLSLVALTLSDVAGGLLLSTGAGWNQTADDWAFFIGQGQAIGFRSASGVLVATAAALVYGGGFGWISMVLVAPDWRHRGLASRLVDACVKRLRAFGMTPVLDATPAGQPVYRQLGFQPGFEFERWEGTLAVDAETAEAPTAAHAPSLRSAGPADLDAIVALDRTAGGAGRRALLEDILGRRGTRAWMTHDGSGFAIVRDGQRAAQFGPLVAADPAGALALLGAALRSRAGALFLDVPTRWRELAAALEARGFVRQRPFARMALGGKEFACGDRQFALAGPEFG
ncbi:MAG: GNAT family N-acetyltransferase [Caldimonas sp.]